MTLTRKHGIILAVAVVVLVVGGLAGPWQPSSKPIVETTNAVKRLADMVATYALDVGEAPGSFDDLRRYYGAEFRDELLTYDPVLMPASLSAQVPMVVARVASAEVTVVGFGDASVSVFEDEPGERIWEAVQRLVQEHAASGQRITRTVWREAVGDL